MKRKLFTIALAAMMLIGGSGAGTAFAEEVKDEQYYQREFGSILENDAAEIKALIEECESKGISTDYETANLRIIELFVPFGLNDASEDKLTAQDRDLWMVDWVGYGDETKGNDKTDRADYILEELKKLSADTIAALQDYLSGSRVPQQTSKYVTSDIGTDGVSFTATDDSGEERPMFFTGYGHFSQAMTDIPIFSDIGVNIIQAEIGISRVMAEDENGNFILDPDSEYLDKFIQMLDNAAEHNIAVNVLLSPHYLPNWFKTKYPDAVAQNYFTRNDDMKRLIEAYIDAVVPRIKDHPAVHSICLTNEPGCQFNRSTDLQPYRDYLNELFGGDIESLNSAYGTDYSDFSEIEFPDYKLLHEPEENAEQIPQIYDFLNFNDKSFTEFHKWMYDLILEHDPDVLAGTKIMQTFDCDEREWRRNFLWRGIDPEMLGGVLTINGNDANNYMNDPQDYQWDINSKMCFYDLQASVSDAPVFDFENHVIRDRDTNYGGEEMANHVASDVWEGTLHGRGGTTLWVWERTYDDTHDFAGSILNRPDVVAETSKTMLDIGRLTDELTALEKSDKRVGILYSKAARAYSNYNSNALMKAYEAAVYSGEKVDFVTANQINTGKLTSSDIEILLVPVCTHVEDGVLEGINDYIAAGGKVIIIGDDSLSANQYNKPLNSEVRSNVFANSTVLTVVKEGPDQLKQPDSEDIWDTICGVKRENSIGSGVEITDSETGEPVYGIACQSTEQDGRMLINICNYIYDTLPSVDISINGQKLQMVKELRSDKVMTGSVELTPYEPILVSAKLPEFEDVSAHWAENDILALANAGIVSGVSAGEFVPERTVTVDEFTIMAQNASGTVISFDGDKQKEITRLEMADILADVCEKKKLEQGGKTVEFNDCGDISDMSSLQAVVNNDLMYGYPDGSFRPEATATRAEAATVIARLARALDTDV